ncbi:MAG: NRDE family protein, partial [Myxococcales bacterium]|nr:NRDE family protein [Myxococcales bacterium]
MCTLLFAWQVDPARPLIVAANRDEFHARPTAAASTWPRDAEASAPEIVAGRDLQAGGTWLGVTREGRFAALTNVREPFVAPPPGARSRGGLVAEFLRGRAAPGEYLAGLAPDAYAGFNLVVGDRSSLWYLSNRSGPARALGPGVYGVSNAALDTPWPKVRRGRENLARLVAAGAASPEAVLALLADRAPAPDAELPDTGVGLVMERV